MGRAAPVDHEIHPLLQGRWSPLAFSDRSIPPQIVRSLFEAARWAPSSYNDQPWGFLAARREQEELFNRILGCVLEVNRLWAARAGVLALTGAQTRFEYDGSNNPHAVHDLGMATAQLTIEAMARDLYVHQMAGFSGDEARAEFAVPEGVELVSVIAIGYLGEADVLPEKLRNRQGAPRTRKPQDGIVFGDSWGEPARF